MMLLTRIKISKNELYLLKFCLLAWKVNIFLTDFLLLLNQYLWMCTLIRITVRPYCFISLHSSCFERKLTYLFLCLRSDVLVFYPRILHNKWSASFFHEKKYHRSSSWLSSYTSPSPSISHTKHFTVYSPVESLRSLISSHVPK